MSLSTAKKMFFLNGGSSVVLNSSYTDILDQATSDEMTLPSTSTRVAGSNFITELQEYSGRDLWAVDDAFWMFAANDINLNEFAELNWKDPASHRLTHPAGAGVYATNGYNWDGASTYGQLNFNPATDGVNYVLDSASRFFNIETSPSIGVYGDGNSTGTNNLIRLDNSAVQKINSTNNLNSTINMGGTGWKALSRIDSTNVHVYNETKSDRTQTSTAILSETQWIGRRATNYSNAIYGCYGFGTGYTEDEMLFIRTQYLAYRTAVGL